MSSKIGLNLSKNYSINFSLPKRGIKKIKFIIIHYTGMKKESKAIEKLCNHKSRVSSHYFIKNSGEVVNLVPDLYEAWHAGISNWKNFKSLNRYSIGVEINNPGHDYEYRKFTNKQILSVINLLKHLMNKYKINKKNVLGHSDIAPDRKKDPGEKFPWKKLAKKNLCHWHNLNEKKISDFRNKKLSLSEEKIFFNNLSSIGYLKLNRIFNQNKKRNLIKAFQRRFRQSLINGKTDKECLLISQNLLKS